MLVIADSAVPAGHEFHGVSSAVRLRDGQILVANAGVPELALFTSMGQFSRTVGRKGQGPGEFQGPISVFRWRADSIAVYDPATMRWTILDPTAELARVSHAPDPGILRPTWLYQGAIVNDGVLAAVPLWVMTALDGARRADPGFERLIAARRDDTGALWIKDARDGRRWAIFMDSGEAAATALLPANLEPVQIGADFILGLVRDSLGLEQLHVHAVQRPPMPSANSDSPVAPIPVDSAVLNALPNLMVAQEVYYASHARYAPHADSLQLRAPFPARLFVFGGDPRHWGAVAVRPETGVTCGVSVGWPAPVGWPDGTPFCGR